MHGGVKFYRGAAKAARAYVERDRSRADDYYLARGHRRRDPADRHPGRRRARGLDERRHLRAVGRRDRRRHRSSGRVGSATDANALRFVEVTVNGPKTWSLAAALHPEISAALDEAQDKAAVEIVGWVAQHATTRVGPRGRQVQVPVEQIEAAVIRHYTSRAGDPHRHLHLQINARVWAAGAWRGIHSVGVRDIDRGDQRDRARRGRDRPAVPGGPRGARVHPRPGDQRDPAARAVRRCVQRPDRADPPQHRPLRSRLAWRASRRGAWSAAARGVGPAGVGASPARQGRPDRRPRARGPLERRAARPRLPRLGRSRAADGDAAGVDRPRRRQPSWSSPSSGRSGRPGTPPTSEGRPRCCSPRPASSPTRPRGSSSPRTSPPGRPSGASDCSSGPMCPSTSGASPPTGFSRSRPTS